MDSGPFQHMLESLRGTFSQRLPAGLTETADARLQRTLRHYVKEVARVTGVIDEQEILRETFDSMAGWFRRNTDHLVGQKTPDVATLSAVGAEPPFVTSTLVIPEPVGEQDQTSDPLILFERMKAARAGTLPVTSTPLPPPIATVVEPVPKRVPELESVETRQRVPRESVQPKDVIIRQEDVVKYREVEHNLILNSKDRNWLANIGENRYDFTIQLNGGTVPQGSGAQATIQNRFRNIVRLEFVKAIMPVEGLNVIVARECPDQSAAPDKAFYSALALPYIQVMLDEYQGNNYGTNQTVDRSFAVCQYDATWKSETVSTNTQTNRGYTLFFPKFMRAQRVYAPTPLSSLQKLSFQILNPENQPLSKIPDAFGVNSVIYSSDISGSCYSDSAGDAATAEYLFIETKTWFPLWAFSEIDKIAFAGLSFQSATPSSQAGGSALVDWLQCEEGHNIVGIAYTSAGLTVQDGANDCGYANWIIIRNRFQDPETGICSRYLFTGSAPAETGLAADLQLYKGGLQKGGVINLSHQVQLVLRVITRELDSGTNVRPDNI